MLLTMGMAIVLAGGATSTPNFLSLPSDKIHGYELSCGIFMPTGRGGASKAPLHERASDVDLGEQSTSLSKEWERRIVQRNGPPTMVLRPERCRTNIRLLAYATDPSTLTNERSLTSTCPPRACLKVMPNRARCSLPSARGVGKVSYHLLYQRAGRLRSRTVVVDFDAINRSYFAAPSRISDPYQSCPLPAE